MPSAASLPTIALDANMVFPALLRDILLCCAEKELYRLRLRQEIWAEEVRNFVDDGRMSRAQAERHQQEEVVPGTPDILPVEQVLGTRVYSRQAWRALGLMLPTRGAGRPWPSIEATRRERVTMGSGFSALTAGMSVRGADAHRVGAIKEIHATDVLIQRRLQPTVHVPLEAIRTVTASEVVLRLTTGEVDELYWMHAGEDFDLNLRGIYKYDYMHP